MAINNPYVPGDPYSYDLKWMVNVTNDLQGRLTSLDAAIQEATDQADRAEHEADRAVDEADRSRDEAVSSATEALKSEGYAVGEQAGVPVSAGSPYYQNNSKYYSEQSADSAQEAADYAAHIADPVSGLVSTWLQNNITQPTVPAIDASLTVYGAAADAQITGNFVLNAIKKLIVKPNDYEVGYYINVSTGVVTPASGYMASGKCDLPEDTSILYIYSASEPTPVVCFYAWDNTYLGYSSDVNNGFGHLLIPSGAAYFRVYLLDTANTDNIFYSSFGTTNQDYTHGFNGLRLGSLDPDLTDNHNLIGEVKSGLYVLPNNGRFTPNANYRAALDLIDASSDVYVTAFFPEGGLASEYTSISGVFLDATLAVLDSFSTTIPSNVDYENGFFKLQRPANTAYIKLCADDNNTPRILYCGHEPYHLIGKDAIKPEYASFSKICADKKIVWMGDSVVGNTTDSSAVTAYLGRKTGAQVINAGFGGTRASVHSGDWDLVSAYRLADDIASGDFTTVTAAIMNGWAGMPGYFRNTINRLNKVDFNDIDVLIMSWGTNDYREPTSVLDNPLDPFDTTTVCGALRYTIRTILGAYPHLNMILTDPIFRVFPVEGTDSDTQNWGSGTLIDYAEAYKQVAEDMGVIFLDLYHTSGINAYTENYFFDLPSDGTHPIEPGRERIASRVSGSVLNAL